MIHSLLASLVLLLAWMPLYANNDQIAISKNQKELFLTPAGKYTQSDIMANGNQVPSQKFQGFIPSHSVNMKTGDLVCPITLTKANPNYTWVVNGKSYAFCCPSCIDEFLVLAKEHPEMLKEPEEYVKK